jgi:hypothetical protein
MDPNPYRDVFAGSGGVPVPNDRPGGCYINGRTPIFWMRNGTNQASHGPSCTTAGTTGNSSNRRVHGIPTRSSTMFCRSSRAETRCDPFDSRPVVINARHIYVSAKPGCSANKPGIRQERSSVSSHHLSVSASLEHLLVGPGFLGTDFEVAIMTARLYELACSSGDSSHLLTAGAFVGVPLSALLAFQHPQ